MKQNLLLIKYQDNIADNLSAYANAKIFAKNYDFKQCYENITSERNLFEDKMCCFNLKCNFISKNRANEITKKISTNKLKRKNKSLIIDTSFFDINNIKYISDDIISDFSFKNTDFILNHDLLEEIKNLNSIGLYISEKSTIDFNYLKRATSRLNKYIKKPRLYIFTQNKLVNQIEIDMESKIIDLDNKKEEFYLLYSCKHKIIHNDNLSHSQGFWASLLNEKDYLYNIYDKKLKVKNKRHNWIEV